ncbi:hypothetical protein A2335_03145 [Candidatus Peregrinibacteria bacterium RIFOXYB2_FULL_32_7]|nr:MAG: hypothetical protein A2335_03145 [Candidatus Peregrinibacteria bacterium RIFOXYB2_FULL_32_7]
MGLILISGCKEKLPDLSSANIFPQDTKVYFDLKFDEESQIVKTIQTIIVDKYLTLEDLDETQKNVIKFFSDNLPGLQITFGVAGVFNPEQELPEVYASFKTKSGDFKEFFSALSEQIKKSDLGENIYEENDGEIMYVEKNGSIILTNKKDNVEKLLARINGEEEGFGANENFINSMKKLSLNDSVQAKFFINFDFYQNLLTENENLSAEDLAVLQKFIGAISTEAGIMEKINNDEFRFSAYANANEEMAKEIGMTFNSSVDKLKLYQFTPKDNLALFAETHDLKTQFDYIKMFLSQNEITESIEAFKDMAITDLSEKITLDKQVILEILEILLNLDENAAFAINLSDQQLVPEITLIAELQEGVDQEKLKANLKLLSEALKNFIAEQISATGFEVAVEHNFFEVEDNAYFVISPDLSVLSLFLGQKPELNLTVGLVGGNLVLSTYKGYVNFDSTLDKDDNFVSKIKSVKSMSPITYLKFEPIAKYLKKINEIQNNEILVKAAEIISNIDEVFASSSAEEYEIVSNINLKFKENGLSNLVSKIPDLITSAMAEYPKVDTWTMHNCNFNKDHWAYSYMDSMTGSKTSLCYNPDNYIKGEEFVNLLVKTIYFDDTVGVTPKAEGVFSLDKYRWSVPSLTIAKEKGILSENFEPLSTLTINEGLDILIATEYFESADDSILQLLISPNPKDNEMTYGDAAELISVLEGAYFSNSLMPVAIDVNEDWQAHDCQFEDVDFDKNYAESLFSNKVLTRCFDPNDKITIAEFIELLTNTVYGDEFFNYKALPNSTYQNLSPTHWAFEFIQIADSKGVLQDINSEFDPDQEIAIGDALNIVSATSYITKEDIIKKIFDGKTPRSSKDLTFQEAVKILYELSSAYWNQQFESFGENAFDDELTDEELLDEAGQVEILEEPVVQ